MRPDSWMPFRAAGYSNRMRELARLIALLARFLAENPVTPYRA